LAIFSIPYVFEGLPDWLFAVCMIMAPLALASAWRIHHLHKKGRLDSEVEWVKLLVDHVYREAQWHRTISATKVFLHGHGFDLWLGVTQILGLGILVGAAILFGLAMNANSAMDEAHEAAEWCVVIAAGASTWPFLTTVLRFLLRSPLSTMDKALCAIGFAPPLYLWYFMAGHRTRACGSDDCRMPGLRTSPQQGFLKRTQTEQKTRTAVLQWRVFFIPRNYLTATFFGFFFSRVPCCSFFAICISVKVKSESRKGIRFKFLSIVFYTLE
jgi:hypothetical protein